MPTLELAQTEYTQLSFMITSLSSTISDVDSLPLSLTAMPTLTQITSTWLLFTSPSSTSAQENQSSVAIGVSVAVVILCFAAVLVAMAITIAVYMYRKKYHIFTRSIVEDPQLKDMYTKYEDTHTLIDDKQTQEEHVVNPLADGDNDDNDVDHEQIELRTVVVESEPADDLHVFKTQTSSADLEPAKPTDSVISSETHVDTHDDTTAMNLRSWDPESEHDVEGENMELQLIQKQQSAAGSSPRASATSVLSDSAHVGTQPQGDGQQQGSGGDHEEMELREIDDDSF